MLTEMDEVLLRRLRFTSRWLWVIPTGFEEVVITSLRIIIHTEKGFFNRSRGHLDFLYSDLHDIRIFQGTLQVRWKRLIAGLFLTFTFIFFFFGIFLIIVSFFRFKGIVFETKTGPKPVGGKDVSYLAIFQAATLARLAHLAYIRGEPIDYTSAPAIHEDFITEPPSDSLESPGIKDNQDQEWIIEKEPMFTEQPPTPSDSPTISRKTDLKISSDDAPMITEYHPKSKDNYQEHLIRLFQNLDQSDLEVKKMLEWFLLQGEKFKNAEIDEKTFNTAIKRFESYIQRKLKERDLNLQE